MNNTTAPTRQRVVKEIKNYRQMIEERPAFKHVPISLQTLVEYCEALIGTETRIPVRYREDGRL